ncbi:hypothetical protein FisN_19Lh242 [Fistulifera solaris]|uniref:Uncharacterized protein n=1 Tax=Fistulifera solaris TaxID=1519565 RepID=A0A1Z5K7Q7_FISSO|nr:hypothetical protein FisN_19Lh242 [Fistulifera solaris]|eukprot:GAX22182.1 hypothetical protein FisN_19Lh242 [Fistulifera solaris]
MKLFGVSSILTSFALQSIWLEVAKANVCMMLYQMADNYLEYFIRQDNNELINSAAIREPTLTTWVYFDSRNYGTAEDITLPLEEVFAPDGTPLAAKFEGSLLMTWDHAREQMVVNASSTVELNSDHPQTLFNFLAYAMTDCVARGSTEYMLILSSHGSGMFGFGGDENVARRRRRLLQANQNIVNAVQSALGAVEGAPAKLDVLGFDAGLMQAVDTLDEYHNITKYYMASQAVEPGHGWAYNFLEPATNALEYAINFHDNFLQQTQGSDVHMTPKTLAIVDADLFIPFLNAWDALFLELSIKIANDKNVHTIMQRSRLNTLAFMGAIDTSDTNTPSAMDIGSFFETFRTMCSIDPNSEVETLMAAAETAYTAMFVSRGNGPGTPPASGMHILWPQRQVYERYDLSVIIESDSLAATGDAPNWINFLMTFYQAAAPEAVSEKSVCLQSIVSDLEATADGRLLLNPAIVGTDSGVIASSALAIRTDRIYVNYGIDLTFLLKGRLRHLKKTIPSMASANRTAINHPLKPNWENAQRRLQTETGDYFILFGGNVLGAFEGPEFVATWDKKFYFLGNSDSGELVYATDSKGGLKSIPVMYFARSTPITAADIPLGSTIERAMFLGGIFGFLTVSPSDAILSVISSYVLYTFDPVTRAFRETPTWAGGQITPVLFSELVVGDKVVTQLVGGFRSTIFPWGEDSDFGVLVMDAVKFISRIDALDSVKVEMRAYDNDVRGAVDFFSASLTSSELGGSTAKPPTAESPSTGPPTASPPTANAPTAGPPTDAPPVGDAPAAEPTSGSFGSRVMLWTALVFAPAVMFVLF